MNSEEILTKAINKAKRNGYFPTSGEWTDDPMYGGKKLTVNVFGVIYSKDFAKAFFGEENSNACVVKDGVSTILPAWKYHLQMMVISDDPIRYLSQYLD